MQYLFGWDKIPGEDNERFIEFLIKNFGIYWVKNGKIDKIENGRAINISSENNYLSLRLNDENTRATLTIDFGESVELVEKTENGRLNIYKMQIDLQYLFSLKNYFIAVTGIFIISLIIGLIVAVKNPGIAKDYLEMMKNSFDWIKTLNPLEIMLIIFLNNAIKRFLALALGVGFGIIPLLFVAGNGIILGMLADSVSRQEGVLFVIAALLPHGIIEVPMVLISAGIGLQFGRGMYLSLKGAKFDIKSELKRGISFYLRWIVPLLFVAAVVETFVTPLVVYLLFPGRQSMM